MSHNKRCWPGLSKKSELLKSQAGGQKYQSLDFAEMKVPYVGSALFGTLTQRRFPGRYQAPRILDLSAKSIRSTTKFVKTALKKK
jgi:hypothetical protein